MAEKEVLFSGQVTCDLTIFSGIDSTRITDLIGMPWDEAEDLEKRCKKKWAMNLNNGVSDDFAELLNEGAFSPKELGVLLLLGYKYLATWGAL